MSRFLFLAIIALGLQAQTAPDAAELTRLLKDFLAGAKAPIRNGSKRGSLTESAISSSMVMTPNTAWSELEDWIAAFTIFTSCACGIAERRTREIANVNAMARKS